MNTRRGFLKMVGGLVGGVAAGAAVRTFPFRVFSFPTEIVQPEFKLLEVPMVSSAMYYDREMIELLKRNLFYAEFADRIGVRR